MSHKPIERTKARIKITGEIFTPLALVDEILDKLPPEVWAVDKTFVDPACGDGNFLVRVIAYKIRAGATVKQALSTTYGVELMADNVEACRERLINTAAAESGTPVSQCLQYFPIVERNIVCHNSLTYCYRFGDSTDEPRKESIGKCQCELCV